MFNRSYFFHKVSRATVRAAFLALLALPSLASCEKWNVPGGALSPEELSKRRNSAMNDIYVGFLNDEVLNRYHSEEERLAAMIDPDVRRGELDVWTDSTSLTVGLPSGFEGSDFYNTVTLRSPVDFNRVFSTDYGQAETAEKLMAIDYLKALSLYVTAMPYSEAIRKIEVESSDESVLRAVVVKDIPYFMSSEYAKYVQCPERMILLMPLQNSGKCTLTVTVTGTKNTIRKVYPVRVANDITFKVYMTPWWFGNIVSRIRFKSTGIMDAKHRIMTIRDSVTVIGYCAYLNAFKDPSNPRRVYVERDTTTYPLQSHTVNLEKGKRKTLRNITKSIRKYHRKTSEGTIWVTDAAHPLGGYYVPAAWHWVPEQVILSLDVVDDDSLTLWGLEIKRGGKKKYKHFITCGPVDEEDEDGDEDDSVKWDNVDDTSDLEGYDFGKDEESAKKEDDNIDDGGDEDGEDAEDLTLEEMQYFKVVFNDSLTPHQRDSVCNALKQFKEEKNPTDLTDEQLDSLKKVWDAQYGHSRSASAVSVSSLRKLENQVLIKLGKPVRK